MLPELREEIREIVASALEVPPAEREVYLDQVCAGKPALRSEVGRLLMELDRTCELRDRPPVYAGGTLVEGDVIGRYRIIRMLGRGGMGEVYEAEDLLLHESVALKTLRSDLARSAGYVRRFQREIQLTRKVTNPNVCRVFDVGAQEFQDSGRPPLRYFTMELLSGETLSARIRRRGRLSREEAFPIAVQMAEGLQAAHAAGIVHTDFKSGNVILVPAKNGVRAVVTDFGLARADSTSSPADETETMRAPGQVIGTVAFMSPEQMIGGTITAASDIYSFGIVLFEMATGRLPFDEQHLIHSAVQRASSEGISARAVVPDLDHRWEAAIARCLQTDPERRFASAADLADWFREGRLRMPHLYWTRRDWIRGGAVLAAVLALVIGLLVWLGRPYRPQPAALDWYAKGVDALHSMTFEAARKALEKAGEADPKFALAHASLARAYDELDYAERAKESMLRAMTVAQETRLSSADEKRLRALQCMVSREYARAAPLVAQLEGAAKARDKPAAALESGWLAQQRDDTEGAAAAYERALQMNPGYAAAKLRLGFILGRRAQDEAALKAFTEAETLYSAASNYEGVTETLFEKARLLNRRSRAAEAVLVIDKALSMARTMRSDYQEISLQLLRGAALRNLGEIERARQVAQQAIDAASALGIDNLATSGLVDLGNSFLVRRDLESAEPYFRRALELAQRGKVRRGEARASASLASLFEARRRPEEAKRFIESALPFYRQAGYRREFIQATLVLGGALAQLGEFEEAVRVLSEALPMAVKLRDLQTEVGVRQRLGDSLRHQGDWPRALEEYERAVELLGPGIRSGHARLACAQLYWSLGRRKDADRSSSEVGQLLTKTQSRQLLAALQLQRAEMGYADGRLEEARAKARMAISAAPAAGDVTEPAARLIEALVAIRTSRGKEGVPSAARVIQEFEQAKLAGSAASARLETAEALAASGERGLALRMALEALGFFEPRRILESVWRAHWVVVRASREPAEAETHSAAARAALDQLRTAWSPAVVDCYLGRPDVKRLSLGM